MSDFLKSFDELFDAILTDYKNQFPDDDFSEGTLLFMKSAALASAVWGLYQHQDWVARQIFADTADVDNMEHHAWLRNINRKAGETDAELLARYLAHIRRPPAGGNKYDYEKWALEVDGVKAAYCIPLGQGLGSVDVVIFASGVDEVPSSQLLQEVYDYIDDLRPAPSNILRVLPPTITQQDINITVSGDNLDLEAIKADIEAYMNELLPGETLTLSKLITIAGNNDASDSSIVAPAANVTAGNTEVIRPGIITVTNA